MRSTPTTRRTFLARGTALAAALALPGARTTATSARAAKPLRLLILGGTGFIGPHFVREAQARGHALTLFNRGKSRSEPLPGVTTLIGDRDGQLQALEGRDWDAVIDNSGYLTRQVRLSTELLQGHVSQYLFISSISAYRELSMPGTTEDAPLEPLADEDAALSRETYGGLKAACERVVTAAFPGRSTILRPTFIAGPGDDSDRFTYWPWRMSKGGTMLAPGTPDDPIQYIDVRDLAAFVIRCVEQPTLGVFNVCTPPGCTTIGRLLDASRAVTGADTRLEWVPAEFLMAERRAAAADSPPLELPIWRPPTGESAGVALVSSARAVGAGLRFRPIEDTVRDTLEWQRGRPAELRDRLEAGLSPDQEAELLRRWSESRRKAAATS